MARPRKTVAVTDEVQETVNAITEDTVAQDAVETVAEVKVETKKTEPVKAKAKEYAAEDLIPCRSVVQGALLLSGARSGLPYKWYGVGDVVEVEYQDLTALSLTRSRYLLAPLFVIEDDELLNQPRWKDVKKVYDTMYDTKDINRIVNLQPAQLKQALLKFPASFRRTLAIEVSNRIEAGTYDSINRIKIFDEVCGTDLMCLVR